MPVNGGPLASPGATARRLLAREGGVVAPGVYDGLTARLADRAGFEAVFLTGAGVSYTSLGRGDLGFIGLAEMSEQARRVTAATQLPVLADADTGYGNAVNVHYAVREFERAGVAGVMIEDQPMPKKCAYYEGMSVVSRETMIGKIQAACDARRDDDFVIIARTDGKAAAGLDDALERVRAYADAGADVVFAEAMENEEQLRAAVQAAPVASMVAMVEGSITPNLRVEELRSMGYRLIVHPNSITRAVAYTTQKVLRTIADEGSTQPLLPEMMQYVELSEVLGVPDDREREIRYSPESVANVESPA